MSNSKISDLPPKEIGMGLDLENGKITPESGSLGATIDSSLEDDTTTPNSNLCRLEGDEDPYQWSNKRSTIYFTVPKRLHTTKPCSGR